MREPLLFRGPIFGRGRGRAVAEEALGRSGVRSGFEGRCMEELLEDVVEGEESAGSPLWWDEDVDVSI